MAYVIVKHAKDNYYEYYFIEDPKVTGVCKDLSAYYTYSGKECNIKPFYEDISEAQADCERINNVNPSGGYAVCPTLD